MGNCSNKIAERKRKKLFYFPFRLLLLLMLVAFVFNCKKKPLTEEYFPHKDGDSWKYKNSEETGYFIREFSGTTSIRDTTRQNWVKTNFDTAGHALDSDTNYIMVTDTMVSSFEYLDADCYVFLKLPLEVDITWTFYIDDEPINARVVSKEEYTVQAGTFSNVYLIKYDDPENDETRWIYYAPNVGIIKDALYDSDGELVSEDELIQYPVED
jgi:hypothetical protein